MDLTVLYAFTPNAVAWTAYLGVLAQYTVYKTRLDSDSKFQIFSNIFKSCSSLVLYTVYCAKTPKYAVHATALGVNAYNTVKSIFDH